jgi:hypothetical protein
MSYYTLPKISNFLIVNPQYNINVCEPHISYSLYNFYNNIKKQIDCICLEETNILFNNYEEIIKIVNPYEYIFSKVPGSKFSVSKLKPKTNDFYELLEIIITFNILETFKNKPIRSFHNTINNLDSNECIELLRENYEEDTIFNFNSITDKNIYEQYNELKFDIMIFNRYHNNMNSYIINFIEFIMFVLRYQDFGGTSIIKIDYIFHKPIIDLLYLISSLFEKVYIIKPNSSNITTFEKYIVCKNFNVISEQKLETYKNNYNKLNNFIKNFNNKNITSILDIEIPYYFINKLDDINIIIGQQQLEALDQIINIFKNKNKYEKIENTKKSNIQKSVSWCEKFKIPYNKFQEKTNIFLPIIKDNNEYSINDKKCIIEEDIEYIGYREDIEDIDFLQNIRYAADIKDIDFLPNTGYKEDIEYSEEVY